MKALAVDSSGIAICFAACSDEKTALLTLDTGMHQSEKLLEGIQCVLDHCNLQSTDLDYTALCSGPGAFTGLRLAFSALKALSLSCGVPVYGIPTLEIIAYPYREWQGAVVPAIDAKKQNFYAAVYRQGVLNSGPFDATTEAILSTTDPEEKLLITGHDAVYFAEQARSIQPYRHIYTFCASAGKGGDKNARSGITALSLLELGGKKFLAKEKALEEYEGPVYIRKSEAEISLSQKTGQKA